MIDYDQGRIVDLGNAARRLLPVHNGQDLQDSLDEFGVQIKYFRDERYQSWLEWDEVNERPIIALNAKQSRADQNFAMLHELGHLLIEYRWLPDSSHQMFDKYLLNIEYARQGCAAFTDEHGRSLLNRFAAAYLIPTDAIRHILRGHDMDYIELTNTIARTFSVPLTMARTRLDIFLAVE